MSEIIKAAWSSTARCTLAPALRKQGKEGCGGGGGGETVEMELENDINGQTEM